MADQELLRATMFSEDGSEMLFDARVPSVGGTWPPVVTDDDQWLYRHVEHGNYVQVIPWTLTKV